MLDLKTNFNQPLMECRMFADLTLINYFGYNLNQEELLGFSGSLDFQYAFCQNGGNSYFNIFGKARTSLKNFSWLVSGEWYSEYNGTLEDLAILTNDFRIPVIVEVDFCELVKYYKNFITKNIVNINIMTVKNYNVLSRLPHEMLVVGLDDNHVLCGDHISNQVLRIPKADFQNLWRLPKPEYGNVDKFYYEYAVLPPIKSAESLEEIKAEIIKLALEKVVLNMKSKMEWDGEAKISAGIAGIKNFLTDLAFISKLPKNNQEFSYELLAKLDKMYAKGMFRKTFAAFLQAQAERIVQNPQVNTTFNDAVSIYSELSKMWREFISALSYEKLRNDQSWNRLQNKLAFILEREKSALKLLSQLLSGEQLEQYYGAKEE